MRLLILDNYDSFTYNLFHLVERHSQMSCDVIQNDKIHIEQIHQYSKIILSPGPGLPSQAGIMPQLLQRFHQSKSILGVCLGFQAIGELFNCPLRNLSEVYHGVGKAVHLLEPDSIFSGCPKTFTAGRYHSWVIDENKVNDQLIVTATDDAGLIMAARHPHWDVKGLQFHPESILSEYGDRIIKNWLSG